MDSKNFRGLMEAYSEVYAPQEVDEAITSEKGRAKAKEMIAVFMETNYEGGRHQNRVNKITC